MTMIRIKNWICFAPNVGVFVEPDAVEASPEELHEAIRVAWDHMGDPILVDACCGGQGPLKDFHDLSYEDYLAMKSAFDAVRSGAGKRPRAAVSDVDKHL